MGLRKYQVQGLQDRLDYVLTGLFEIKIAFGLGFWLF